MALPETASNITKSANAIEIFKGQSLDLQVDVIQDGIVPETGEPGEVPVPLDGATVYFAVRRRVDDPRAIFEKSSVNYLEITIVSPAKNGQVVVHVSPADTKNIDAGIYVFDVWVKLASGKIYPVIEVSQIKVKQPVTVVP